MKASTRAGAGDVQFLRLIDESWRFIEILIVPSVADARPADWTLSSRAPAGAPGGSRAATACATAAAPLLQDPVVWTLQHSLDLVWDNQGDGKRMGSGDPRSFSISSRLNGRLAISRLARAIVYKEGDGNLAIHDWFRRGDGGRSRHGGRSPAPEPDRRSLPSICRKMERAFTPSKGPAIRSIVSSSRAALAPRRRATAASKQPDGTFGKGHPGGPRTTTWQPGIGWSSCTG